jgi:hypothetical protein
VGGADDLSEMENARHVVASMFVVSAMVALALVRRSVIRSRLAVDGDGDKYKPSAWIRGIRSLPLALPAMIFVAVVFFPLKIVQYHLGNGLAATPARWNSDLEHVAIMRRLDDPSLWSIVIFAFCLLLIVAAQKSYSPLVTYPRYSASRAARASLSQLWRSTFWFVASAYLCVVAWKGETFCWLLGADPGVLRSAGRISAIWMIATIQAIEGTLNFLVIGVMTYYFATATIMVRRLAFDAAKPGAVTPPIMRAACALGGIGTIAVSAVALAPLVYTLTLLVLNHLGLKLVIAPDWFQPWNPVLGLTSMLGLALPFFIITHLAVTAMPGGLRFDFIRFNLLHGIILLLVCFWTMLIFVAFSVVALFGGRASRERIKSSRKNRIKLEWARYRRLLSPGSILNPGRRLWFQMLQVAFSFTTFVAFLLPKD